MLFNKKNSNEDVKAGVGEIINVALLGAVMGYKIWRYKNQFGIPLKSKLSNQALRNDLFIVFSNLKKEQLYRQFKENVQINDIICKLIWCTLTTIKFPMN